MSRDKLTITEDVDTGKFIKQTRRNVEISQFLDELRANVREGKGYVEISRHSYDYPVLCISYKNALGVIQAFSNAETSLVLKGEDIFEPDKIIDLPAMGELVPFTGDLIIDTDTIMKVVEHFSENFDLDILGEWYEL